MRLIQPIILCLILLLSSLPMDTVSAESQTVCCDSNAIELHLLGPANAGMMTPFDAELGTEAEEVAITDAVAQEQMLAEWSISPAWPGEFPSSTWEFDIQYEVKNAGGAQINASVEVMIGGETHTGTTDASNSFLPAGSSVLSISIPVDSGSISGSSSITVTLKAQTVVFSVPSGDAGLFFRWGTADDDSSINANIPLVDLTIEEPVVEGLDTHISLVIASPWGTSVGAYANSLEMRINNAALNGDPIQTRSGEYVRLTWTWTAATGGEQNITIEASIQIQSGTPTMSGTAEFTIYPQDDGSGGGGVFYPDEEPLRSDGGGSPLAVQITMDVYEEKDKMVIDRVTTLSIDGEIAYWMRWGFDNIGNEDPALSQPLRIFRAGAVDDDLRRNRVVDEVEINEFEHQMVNLAMTYMNDGMAIELEELLGNDVTDLIELSFEIDLHKEYKVTPHPLTLTIKTKEIAEKDSVNTLLRHFLIPQATPIWSSFDLMIQIDTDLMSSLTGAELRTDDDSFESSLKHRRGLSGESIEISQRGIDPSTTFSLTALPSTNILNAPLSLNLLTLILLGGGFWFALTITKDKRRNALWIELVLVPFVLITLWYSYPPFTVGAIACSTVIMWIITAFASPKRRKVPGENLPTFPMIDCPACSTVNPVTTDTRPFRMPCGGCGRVLKIVD